MTLREQECEALWFQPENLSQEGRKDAQELRQRLIASECLLPGHDDDITMLRFLKGRHGNMAAAELMYKNMARWRLDTEVDKLYETFDFPEIDDFLQFYPQFFHKQDKYGRPIYIELLGKTDPAKVLEVTSLDRILKYHIWTWERFRRTTLPAVENVLNNRMVTMLVIIDLAGLSMKNFTLSAQKVLTTITKVDQDCYPEYLGEMLIINTPFFFKAIWSLVYPILDARTRSKISVLGTDYQPVLRSLIPKENMPDIFGGSSPCNGYRSIGPWLHVEPCKSSPWFPQGPRPRSSD